MQKPWLYRSIALSTEVSVVQDRQRAVLLWTTAVSKLPVLELCRAWTKGNSRLKANAKARHENQAVIKQPSDQGQDPVKSSIIRGACIDRWYRKAYSRKGSNQDEGAFAQASACEDKS